MEEQRISFGHSLFPGQWLLNVFLLLQDSIHLSVKTSIYVFMVLFLWNLFLEKVMLESKVHAVFFSEI